jgi:hypothetical protein
MTSLYSEPIPATEITSDWCKFHFPRDSRVITCVNLTLGALSECQYSIVQSSECIIIYPQTYNAFVFNHYTEVAFIH